MDSATLERLQRYFYLRYYFAPPQFMRYLRRRAVYRLTDPTEWQLGLMSLKYLLGNRGRTQAAANAPRPVAAPEGGTAQAAQQGVDGGTSA